ncbi:FTP domain-containing protein [Sulfidibacter corallicola]|uniref:FTP domain-containing protein n=1 Tax=Sulfidibacter corallicola TaxID=2818388 RepID=A0A8A4TPW3_SULCO|nr:hypothetical protein [Sulfidibacter corallicola]QTD52009.1 hypothetical protein J3U87_06005 [Sulfidibacter corallicola]
MKHVLLALWLCAASAVAGQPLMNPEIGTPRMLFHPEFQSALKGEELARAYLASHWQTFKLSPNAENLTLVRVQESLLAKHYTFQQMVRGLEVEEATIIVSVDLETQRINRVSNTAVPYTAEHREHKLALSADDAQDVAWQHLRVHGELLAMPQSKLVYRAVDGKLKLIRRVTIATDAPFGDWSIAVDAVNGKVLDVEDRMISVDHREPVRFSDYTGPVADRLVAVEDYQARRDVMRKQREALAEKRATGRATIFDPDPVTVLLNDTLEDFTSADVFEPAYQERELLDITESGGTFSLVGPWVQVVDIESPAVSPSTTTDGFWNFRRGDLGFNDAMTYYHVDVNQRYMQSLGYKDTKGIQFGSIEVDANGQFGADNSAFSPSGNFLTFGHGCVDDNEDADVIIHEYGHAIQWSINNWGSSGDMGAMGEGFGDYWAGSWSIRTDPGLFFNPNRVFTWDGHNACWDGRIMNNFQVQYASTRTYTAHQRITGGISDELWSTPTFQTLLELVYQGIPREEVDTIILESMFGLGSGIRMSQWASAIVSTARQLYPDGPHARVFQNAFARHGIMDQISSYQYLATHVPPASGSWANEITVTNPNTTTANLTVVTYESDDAGNFSQSNQDSQTLAAGQTLAIVPPGTNQRWVSVTSDQPLSGTNTFTRMVDSTVGREKASLPLSGADESATSLILPHVPADRDQFWSGFVLVNPNASANNIKIDLFGDDGSNLNALLNASAPTSLSANQKWVSFLAEGPSGETGLFDDSASAVKVSWVRITADADIAGFQLYGYRTDRGEAAASGIIATPDQRRDMWPLRVSLTEADWTGFSILNPTDASADVFLRVYGKSGSLMAEETVSIPAQQKMLGLNILNAPFVFPFGSSNPIISLNDSSNIQTVVASSTAPLRIFGLTGDTGNTRLDGSAVLGLTTRTSFTNPVGKLEIFKARIQGTVTVKTFVNGSETSSTNYDLQAGHSMSLDYAADSGITSVTVQGNLFTAALIYQDSERSLTVVEGKQVEYNPANQN